MFDTYILPVLIFAGIGLLAGTLLTVASKIFEVKTDERIEKITEALPQANCGACGYAGCADYANAIITKGAAGNLCRPGGTETAKIISEISGNDAGEVEEMQAVIHCCGDCNATSQKYNFTGVKSCASVKRFYSGEKSCAFGCLGYGDCAEVCEYNGITIRNGIAHIKTELCVGCGQCALVCPNQLISLKPKSKHTVVKCSSADNGKATKLSCKNGCIGCKMCEKACEAGAITVTDFHASIDYSKCTDCGTCIEKCPVKVIKKI